MPNMMNRKPTPLYVVEPMGKKCPICGKTSYSAAGIHPQCAMVQADAPRQKLLAAEKRALKARTQLEK